MQNAKEPNDPQAGEQAAAQPPLGNLTGTDAHLRQGHADREHEGIERMRLIADHGVPQAHIGDKMDIPDEVEDQVADTRGRESCEKYP